MKNTENSIKHNQKIRKFQRVARSLKNHNGILGGMITDQ